MFASERNLIAIPKCFRQFEAVFQLLEAFRCGWKGNAIPFRFILVPRRADSKISASAGKDIEGVDHLHQHGRMAVNHACDQNSEERLFGQSGKISECGVSFQHRVGVDFSKQPLDLIVMIHHPQAVKACCFCSSDNLFQFGANIRRAAGNFERWNL